MATVPSGFAKVGLTFLAITLCLSNRLEVFLLKNHSTTVKTSVYAAFL